MSPFIERSTRREDSGLALLLVVQGLTLFAALPFGAAQTGGRLLLDAGHLAFAVVCVTTFTRRPIVRGALLAGLAYLAAAPVAERRLSVQPWLGMETWHETLALQLAHEGDAARATAVPPAADVQATATESPSRVGRAPA